MLGDGLGGFGNFKEYDAGRFLTDIVTDDFNNDDFLDLVVVNSDDHNASMFFGDGDGGFIKHHNIRLGKYPHHMTSNDFNQDGFLDIAYTHYDFAYPSTMNGDAISVLFGLGNGRFGLRRIYFAGFQPWGIFSGKFNKDRFPDIAVTDWNQGSVNIFLNRIFGRFRRSISYNSGEMPIHIASGDFNMDGSLDLAVSNYNDGLLIHYNNGRGRFYNSKFFEAGRNSCCIASGDFNTDSYPDLAVTNIGDNDFSVLLNDGKGNLIKHKDYPTGDLPYEILIADFNKDGLLDIVIANCDEKEISIYLGIGNGSFVKYQDIPIPFKPTNLVIGNFNSRRKPDTPEINGENVGKSGVEYVFSFVSNDPYGLDLSYYINWGDGTVTDWTSFQDSGMPYNESHNWSKSWLYTLKAKVKNTNGNESEWSVFRVLMPRAKETDISWFHWLLNRFPLLERLLSLLLL
jgi:hypothetical protein